jgi:hypothetical protein
MANDRKKSDGHAAVRERADQQIRLIYIGSGVVLFIAALAVAIGLFITRYQPPRAQVLTVDGQSYQARDVVTRGGYFAFFDSGIASLSDVARGTVDRLIEEAALRSQASKVVALVNDEDIIQALYLELDLVSPLRQLPSTASDETATPADSTETATATLSPAPTVVVDPEELTGELTEFLRDAGLNRDTYESIVEARLYRERLHEYFEAAVGESGSQLNLQRIRVSTQSAADTLIEALDEDADFATLADSQSVAEEDGDGGDLGWTVLALLDEEVRDAVDGLSTGEHSAVIEAGVFFEIYRVAEVMEDGEYEGLVASQLAGLRFDEWLETAIARLEVERDLSADEESWINERVLDAVPARLGG